MKKFLTSELYIKCFNENDFDKSEDKFLIGYLNKEGDKLKDVITGQIVEGYFISIYNKGEKLLETELIACMRERRGFDMTMLQAAKAETIASVLTKEVIDKKQLAQIKKMMNKEIIKYHKKIMKELKRKEELNQYSIDESERDF